MDLYARLASPVEAVFGYLADPARLEDWLREVVSAPADPEALPGVGAAFPLAMRLDGICVPGSGEMIAFEPPWLVGYRLFAARRRSGCGSPAPRMPGGPGSACISPTTPCRSPSTWPGWSSLL